MGDDDNKQPQTVFYDRGKGVQVADNGDGSVTGRNRHGAGRMAADGEIQIDPKSVDTVGIGDLRELKSHVVTHANGLIVHQIEFTGGLKGHVDFDAPTGKLVGLELEGPSRAHLSERHLLIFQG